MSCKTNLTAGKCGMNKIQCLGLVCGRIVTIRFLQIFCGRKSSSWWSPFREMVGQLRTPAGRPATPWPCSGRSWGRPSLIFFRLPARGRGMGMAKFIEVWTRRGAGIRSLPWRVRSTRVVVVEKVVAPP
jgi:hypothetical protein